jgi:hypothetical protein
MAIGARSRWAGPTSAFLGLGSEIQECGWRGCVPRQRLVTAEIIGQIESWVDTGLSAAAIAEKIGCTLGTLRVRCSQFGISLRRKTRAVRRGRGIADGRLAVLGSADLVGAGTARRETTDPIGQDEDIAISLPEPILRGLRTRAAQNGISDAALAAKLLETIVMDDLYEAVLDVDEATSASGNQVIPSA